MMDPAHYRIRLLSDVCFTLLLPLTLLRGLLVFSQLSIPQPYNTLAYVASIPAFFSLRIVWDNLRQRREAMAMHARQIPRVVGKWPGNIDVLLRMMKDFKTSYIADVYLQLFKEHQCTTLNLRILWRDTIITMDQEHTKFVLATGFEHFWRGYSQKERMETFLGTGIFNRDDDVWKMHRNIARPFFARDRFQDFELFEKYAAQTLSILNSLAAAGESFDAQDLYSRFSLDAASEFLFGKNLDTLSERLPRAGMTKMGLKGSAFDEGSWGSFATAFEAAQTVITQRQRVGYIWPLLELFKDKNEVHAKVVHDWLDPLVRSAILEKQKSDELGVKGSIDEKTFLEHLVGSTDDVVIIRDQLLNVLLAARDTTATALTYATYLLALHPNIMDKLRAEVIEHCGASGRPTQEHFRKMRYLRGVINETLRLFPPVPVNVRETRSSPCVLPKSDQTYRREDNIPLYVPGNTLVVYVSILTHRNPVLWGEDADAFDPERWTDERLSKFVANPTIFAPFGAGPRICIGQNYAYNEMSYFLVRLLQQFDRFTLQSEDQPEGSLPPPEWKHREGRQREERIWPAAALTLFVKGGLWVKFHRTSV